ncbi:MAG: 50S ribosomal protein L10, partial [Candidatus Bilamarchaeaceae archaeon]
MADKKETKAKAVKKEASVPEKPKVRKAIAEKAARVDKILAEMKKQPNVALIDLRGLPDALFQSARKKLREQGAVIYVSKKAVLNRVFDSDPKLKDKKGELEKTVGFVLAPISPNQINSFFRGYKKQLAAKSGQVAPFDIVVPAGETDLPPGPALSELKNAGINAQIKAGKIAVAKDSVVAKKGEVITPVKAAALQKLNVKPFEASVKLIFAYDGEFVYSVDALDMGANIGSLLSGAFNQGRNVGVNASVYSDSVMELLLSQAVRQGMALSPLEKKEGEAKPAEP